MVQPRARGRAIYQPVGPCRTANATYRRRDAAVHRSYHQEAARRVPPYWRSDRQISNVGVLGASGARRSAEPEGPFGSPPKHARSSVPKRPSWLRPHMGTDGDRMGTEWGQPPTPRPTGAPGSCHAWQGRGRCSRKQAHRFGSPNLPLWVTVGGVPWRGDTSRSTRFLHSKKKSAKLLLLGISPGISLLLFVGEVASLGPGLRGPVPCLALLWPQTYGLKP